MTFCSRRQNDRRRKNVHMEKGEEVFVMRTDTHPGWCGQGNEQACQRRGMRCAWHACALPDALPGWLRLWRSPRTQGSSWGTPGTGCPRCLSAAAGCSSSCSDLHPATALVIRMLLVGEVPVCKARQAKQKRQPLEDCRS